VSDVVIPASTEQWITESTFRFAGTFRYASVRAIGDATKHLMITRDGRETTVVTTEELLSDLDVIALNADRWLLLAIECANPFYCVGFIAKISAALSGAEMDILVVSTFSCDWVLVREQDGDRAAELLRSLGFRG
jgi:hypothetical protein